MWLVMDSGIRLGFLAPHFFHMGLGRGIGIDRKDNSSGYVESNVVPCCEVCNKAKLCMGYEEFIAYLIRAGNFLSRSRA